MADKRTSPVMALLERSRRAHETVRECDRILRVRYGFNKEQIAAMRLQASPYGAAAFAAIGQSIRAPRGVPGEPRPLVPHCRGTIF